MRPDERLPTKRTASIGSRVPPAVTSTEARRARRRPPRERGLDRREQRGRLGQPADPPLARRAERSRARLEHCAPRVAQRREVGLRGGVVVHRGVHRRRHDRRAAAGERGGAVRRLSAWPVRELRQRVGRRGRDQEGVGALDQREVRERRVRRAPGRRGRRRAAGRAPTPSRARGAGDRRERRGADEAPGRLRLDHPHGVAGLVPGAVSSSAL